MSRRESINERKRGGTFHAPQKRQPTSQDRGELHMKAHTHTQVVVHVHHFSTFSFLFESLSGSHIKCLRSGGGKDVEAPRGRRKGNGPMRMGKARQRIKVRRSFLFSIKTFNGACRQPPSSSRAAAAMLWMPWTGWWRWWAEHEIPHYKGKFLVFCNSEEK